MRGWFGHFIDDVIGPGRRTVADIRIKITERSKQNAISRAFHAKHDSQAIAGWRLDLNRILIVFNVRDVVLCELPALNAHS